MNKMLEIWEKLNAKFELIPNNYRLSTLLGSLLAVFAFWFIIVDTPINHEQKRLKLGLSESKYELMDIQDKISAQMNSAAATNGNSPTGSLEQELTLLEEKIYSVNNPNLAKKKLAQLLQNFVNPNDNLQLRSLKWSEQSNPSVPSDMQNTILTVSFDADYFSMLDYLKRLDLAGMPVYLDKMHYEVTTAPKATVELEFDIYSKKQTGGK